MSLEILFQTNKDIYLEIEANVSSLPLRKNEEAKTRKIKINFQYLMYS
jgi:hypothetical protein